MPSHSGLMTVIERAAAARAVRMSAFVASHNVNHGAVAGCQKNAAIIAVLKMVIANIGANAPHTASSRAWSSASPPATEE